MPPLALDVLTLPGLLNSGPQHWQTHWGRQHPAWRRVAHDNWETPDRARLMA
jgi:predicted alpha/beta hydrolase family esterase